MLQWNPKELAGKKCDAKGQIWNESGNVLGRYELILKEEREAKPEAASLVLRAVSLLQAAWSKTRKVILGEKLRKVMPKSLLDARSMRMEISSIHVVLSKDTLNYVKSRRGDC